MVRVFVSSTFLDFQNEREYLLKKVFPEIRAITRERGLQFTEIDLRWGLTRDDTMFGAVIRTCLEEIDRCRPFFIGLLGSRYGSPPQYSDVQKDPELIENFPWIEEAVLEGASILDMEIRHAVLNNPQGMDGAYFYRRSEKASGKNTSISEDETVKLTRLIASISESGRPIRDFESVEELGLLVKQDLINTINRLWPPKSGTLLEEERRRHEAFAANRRQAYIANPKYLSKLSDHVDTSGEPLVLTGPSGIGKSALLAYWSNIYEKRNPDKFILRHFVGATSSGSNHTTLLRRILCEIKIRFGIEEEVPVQPEEIERLFPLWLARTGETKIVLIIDALNQLEGNAHILSWLPQFFPTNVSVIVSTTPGKVLAALEERKWPLFTVAPLSQSVREALIVRFLREYRKSIGAEQCKRIAKHTPCESPLYLRTLLEELRLFGYFEQLDEHIDHYLKSEDLDALFELVLERMERDFGKEKVQSIMTYVWASRTGLAETELLDLTCFNRAELSQLLIALDYHLMQRDGLYKFFHQFLENAVEKYYLENKEEKKKLHSRLAGYYQPQPLNPRRLSELGWHLEHAGEQEMLADYLSDIPSFIYALGHGKKWDTVASWRWLENENAPHWYARKLEQYKNEHSQQEYIGGLQSVGEFLFDAGHNKEAGQMLQEALTTAEKLFGKDSVIAIDILTALGNIRQAEGDYAASEEMLRRSLSVSIERFGNKHPLVAKSMDSLASVLYLRGNYKEAEELLRDAVTISETSHGPEHLATANYLKNLGAILYTRSAFDEAEQLFRRALSITQSLLGDENPEVASILNNLGAVYDQKKSYGEAINFYEKSYQLNLKSLGPQHEETLAALTNLGAVQGLFGDVKHAMSTFEKALNCCNMEQPLLKANVLENLAALSESSDLNITEKYYRGAVSLRSAYPGFDLIQVQLKLANTLRQVGKISEALRLFEETLPKKILLLGDEHPSVAWSEMLYSLALEVGGFVEEKSLIRTRYLPFLTPQKKKELRTLEEIFSTSTDAGLL